MCLAWKTLAHQKPHVQMWCGICWSPVTKRNNVRSSLGSDGHTIIWVKLWSGLCAGTSDVLKLVSKVVFGWDTGLVCLTYQNSTRDIKAMNSKALFKTDFSKRHSWHCWYPWHLVRPFIQYCLKKSCLPIANTAFGLANLYFQGLGFFGHSAMSCFT